MAKEIRKSPRRKIDVRGFLYRMGGWPLCPCSVQHFPDRRAFCNENDASQNKVQQSASNAAMMWENKVGYEVYFKTNIRPT